MSNISSCLDLMNDIDDQMFLAECNVMSAHNTWMSKISEMVEYYGGFDNIPEYVQEAEYGRRDTGGNKWLNKIRMFILRCIDKIVDAITNFLLKIKTRKAEYIRIPYKYEDLMEDIDLVKSIDKDIYQIFDNVENFTSDDNIRKLTSIKEKLKNTHFAKKERLMISDKDPEAYNMNNKYGVKPDKYMILAKDLRNLNRALKDTKRRASKMVGDEWLKGSESTDKSRRTVTELLFNIYTEMSRMIVKLMRSFTVSGVEKMNSPIEKKTIETLNNSLSSAKDIMSIIGESDIDDVDDDIEYFDETEKPYEAYLKKHNYDPKTNTIEVDGKRWNAGAIGSKKERNRINRFLRENDYDPKTGTILTDIDDNNGKKKRIKFVIDPSLKDNAYYNSTHDVIVMGPYGDHGISGKPKESNSTFKHEEGHAAQHKTSKEFDDKANEYVYAAFDENKDDIAKAVEIGHERRKLTNAVKDRQTQSNLMVDPEFMDDYDNHKSNTKRKTTDHDDAYEADADLYAMMHNPYKSNAHDVVSRQRSKNTARNIKMLREADANILKESIKTFKRRLNDANIDLNELEKFYQEHKSDMKLGEKIKYKLQVIHNAKKHVNSLEFTLGEYEDALEKVKKNERIPEYIASELRPLIRRYFNNMERVMNELDNREEFLSKYNDEAGSQARKLEGRQGKHKGKQ